MATKGAHQLATAVGVIKFAIIFKTAAQIKTTAKVSRYVFVSF